VGSLRANRLDGQGGEDTLGGGRGNDTLIGGAAGDTFVFAKQSGSDLVTLFQNNLDQIDLTAFNYANTQAALSHFTLIGRLARHPWSPSATAALPSRSRTSRTSPSSTGAIS
jgi:Ca2+-binding RTX toxin-like protein